MRVQQRGRQSDFAREPLDAQAIGEFWREDFHDHVATECFFAGDEDAGHAAAANLGGDGVGGGERSLKRLAERIRHAETSEHVGSAWREPSYCA